jgi:septal ring factor EnvC (AmiA/AmiB activator)
MTKREIKKKRDALWKELQKTIKSHTKASHYLHNLTKVRDMLYKKIAELDALKDKLKD